MKQIIDHVNYGTFYRNVQLKIDEACAERSIPADDSVRLSDQIVEEMDSTPLMRYIRTGRRPAKQPDNSTRRHSLLTAPPWYIKPSLWERA